MPSWVDQILGSNIPYITYAVPIFFLLIGIEVLIGWIEHKELYRLNDTINDLSCGILQQVVGIFMRTILFAGYLWIYQHHALVDMSQFSPAGKWWAALALFLGVDFCYYWFHRFSHEMNGPWAGHVVHHQSEEYNLAVALRQGTFQACFSWVFYLPLAWIGFPPLWFVAMSSFNTLYQFWIHTKTIGKLGWFEWIFNTPSHHRVHHGRNPKYLDKNHAGTLIIWDRMFGTFQEEQEEVVYGITRPLKSWNPVWANLEEFVHIYQEAKAAPYWVDKIKIWFMHPSWRPRGLLPTPTPAEVTPQSIEKYDARVPRGMGMYTLVHFVLALFISVGVMGAKGATLNSLVLPTVYVMLTLVSVGGLFERRGWVLPLEIVRLSLLMVMAGVWSWGTNWFTASMIVVGVVGCISAIMIWSKREMLRAGEDKSLMVT